MLNNIITTTIVWGVWVNVVTIDTVRHIIICMPTDDFTRYSSSVNSALWVPEKNINIIIDNRYEYLCGLRENGTTLYTESETIRSFSDGEAAVDTNILVTLISISYQLSSLCPIDFSVLRCGAPVSCVRLRKPRGPILCPWNEKLQMACWCNKWNL